MFVWNLWRHKIHALGNIMPIKGDITRGKEKYNLPINPSKKKFI